jgi:hypothetical protein
MIDVTCQQCGAVYHSEQTHIGKHLRCSRCGCLVPISTHAQRAVAQQSPAFPDAASRKANTPSPKHPTRRFGRIYPFAIAAVAVAVGAVSLVLLRHPTVSKQGAAGLSNIEEPAQPQQNQKADNAMDFQTDASPATSPEASAQSPELQFKASDVEVQGESQPSARQKHVQAADPRPTHYHSLPTGSRIEEDVGTSGHGELTVENGTSEDAVARLFDAGTDQTVRWFFVQAHSSTQLAQIPQGTYRLTFTTGLNWVESEDTFSWRPSYSEFERAFEYSEQHDSEGLQYHSISVTLHSVPLGNVRTKAITREEFLKGHRHVALQRP